MRLTTFRTAWCGERQEILKEYGSMENLWHNEEEKKDKEKDESKISANTMNCQLPDRKNRCPFNELEFRRMAEQFDSYLKRDQQQQASPSDDANSPKKAQQKKAKTV
jgi:DNA polymerase-1